MEKVRNFIFGHPIIPFSKTEVKKKGNGFYHKNQEYIHYSTLHHSESAFSRFSRPQLFVLLALSLLTLLSLIISWHTTLVIIVTLLTILYFIDLLFNLFLIYRSFHKSTEVKITQDQIKSVKTWPKYTILCPLYKEWEVVPQFISAMSKLDYPKNMLQVMLLLEEDDERTIKEVAKMSLPSYFETVIVPHSKPKTKPKACNYGLKFAKGDYVVIYDAEDVPEASQLKKAVFAFNQSDSNVKCIQAKLNFYNPSQNIISRVFTAEYSLWFELVLTGLQSINAPIPLGGTSNHFKKQALIDLNGWDSFNVTEDADLGMRIVKRGFKTVIIDSLTLEEANSQMKNWFEQRTRWIKGYMQTYLLHMRRPQEFVKNWRDPHVLTFQMVVGGKVLSMLINPLMWVTTITYFLFRPLFGDFLESLYLAPVLYMGVLSLFIGNFLYTYYYMIGCAKHGHHSLVKYVILVPFYWVAMSAAAWTAMYRLITNPHYWSKTKHGLHLEKAEKRTRLSFAFPKIKYTYSI